MIRTNTKLGDISYEEIKKIVELTISYCYIHMGRNKRRGDCEVLITDQSPTHEMRYGEYHPDCHVMLLFKNNITNVRCLIETTLHEYTHTLQPCKTNYSKLFHKYGYDNHPYEIEARNNENLINEVWPKIRKELLK